MKILPEKHAEIAMRAANAVNGLIKAGYSCDEVKMYNSLVKSASNMIVDPSNVSKGIQRYSKGRKK